MSDTRQSTRETRRVAALVLCLICVVYAPLAFPYPFHFYSDRAPQLAHTVLVDATSPGFAEGPASVHMQQDPQYRGKTRPWMTLHMTTGAIALFLGIWQFSDRLRRRRVRLHRRIGKAYAATMFLSMVGSAGFLVSVARGDSHFYTGPPFGAALWGLWGATVASGTLALLAIRAGDVRRHSEWMALNYSMLLTAPLLRVGWMSIGHWSPGLTQADANLAQTVFLFSECVLIAALWRSYRTRAQPVRLTLPADGGDRTLRILQGGAVFGIVALVNDLLVRIGAPRFSPLLLPDTGFFQDGGIFVLAYAFGSGVAMLAGCRLFRAGLYAPSSITGSLPALRTHVGGVVLGSVGLLGFAVTLGDRLQGGIVSVYYWISLVPFWCLPTALMVNAVARRRTDRVQEWAVYSIAMSFQSALFHLTYILLGLFGYASPGSRAITAAILSFSGVYLISYAFLVRFGTAHPSRLRGVAANQPDVPVSA